MHHSTQSKKAILILDVQNDFTGIDGRMPVNAQQAVAMIENLNGIIDRAKQPDLTVIYIGNEYNWFDIGNIFRNFASLKGTAGTELDSRLHVKSASYFSKNKMNAFSNPKLGKFLKDQNITALYIGGVYAEACVYETAKGAIAQNYQTYVLTDCIASKKEIKKTGAIKKFVKIGARTISSAQVK